VSFEGVILQSFILSKITESFMPYKNKSVQYDYESITDTLIWKQV